MTGTILDRLLADASPKEAMGQLIAAVQGFLPLLGEEDRREFIRAMFGAPGDDKIVSMVHLWLAECLDEGVDPTKMCQSLVDKIGRSGQLVALAHPEVLALFEDWLEELEDEVASLPTERRATPAVLARELGVSVVGAAFLLAKLDSGARRETSVSQDDPQ